jgi:hypothetical protein
MNDDRTVHAKLKDGGEVVRYGRASKWFIEYPIGHMIPCQPVKLEKAVRLAVDGMVFAGRPGGSRFDAAVRKARGL